MARKTPHSARELANLKPFKKGEVRNPLGRKAHKSFQVAAHLKKLTIEQVQELATAVVDNNLETMMEIKDDPKSSVLKVWIASVAVHGIKKGDMSSLNLLLDRIIGKAKETITLTGDNINPVRLAAQQMTQEERAAEITRLQTMRLKAGEE